MSEEKDSELEPISSFFVFDSEIPPGEGVVVKTLYFYPEVKTKEDINRRDVEAGISSTFLFFCKNFQTSNPCDYIFTGKREISILRIDPPNEDGTYDKEDGIFFSVSIHSTTSTRRLLLQQILITCREIMNITIEPLKRDEKTGAVDKRWVSRLCDYMPYIIKVINWKDPVFELLWDAYAPSTSHMTEHLNRVNDKIKGIMKKYPMLDNIIITWRDKIITFQPNSTAPELVRLLALLVYHKFTGFFPKKIKRREGRLQWTVGFSINELGIVEFNSPPVYYKGKRDAMCVLQLNKIRIIILFDITKVSDINCLRDFSADIGPIARNLDCIETRSFSHKKVVNFKSNVGVDLHHTGPELLITSNKVQIYDYSVIERGVLLAHEFSNRYTGERGGLIPLGNGFYSKYNHDNDGNDDYTVMHIKSKSISDSIEQFNEIKE